MVFTEDRLARLLVFNQISNELPSGFKLEQNYPNPFNPGTVIRFQLPVDGFVTLKIFNLLGEEVTTLVRESLKPDTYEIEWNASSYPSGVYFYNLGTEKYTATKKMILVK